MPKTASSRPDRECHCGLCRTTLVRNDTISFRLFSTDAPIASRSILPQFDRAAGGVLRGAAFRQRPLSPLTSQGSCRDKNLAPGGNSAESFYGGKSIRTVPLSLDQFLPASVSRLQETREPPSPKGRQRDTDCHVGRWPPRNDIRCLGLLCKDVTKNCGKLFPFYPCYHRENIV